MQPFPNTRLTPHPVLFLRLTCVFALFACVPADAQGPGRVRLSVPAPQAHYGPGYYYHSIPAPVGPVVPAVLLPAPSLPPAPTSRDGAHARGFFRRRG